MASDPVWKELPSDVVVVRFDGGARPTNPGPAACAWMLSRVGVPPITGSAFLGEKTNNEAEYQGLLNAMRNAHYLGFRHLDVRSDSKLVVEQMSGRWKVRSELLRPLYQEAIFRLAWFGKVTFTWVPREENVMCDALCTAKIEDQIG